MSLDNNRNYENDKNNEFKEQILLETASHDIAEEKKLVQEIGLNSFIRDQYLSNFKIKNNDFNLKVLSKLLLKRKGYYCEYECRLYGESYVKKFKKEEFSDIDVLGIKFEEDLRVVKAGFECKNTETNGVDEALKIKGIQELCNFDYVGLMKKKISNNVRLVSAKLDIQLHDSQELRQIVDTIVRDVEKKISREIELYKVVNSIELEIKAKNKGLINYTKSGFWTNKPYQNINTIIRGLENIRDNVDLNEYQMKFLSIRMSILLSISLLEICSFIVRHNLNNCKDVALDQLFGGAAARREKERTFDLLSQELGKKLYPLPYYTVDYLTLVEWIIMDIESASNIVLCLDEYLVCYLLGYDMECISETFTPETLKISKDILRFTNGILKTGDIHFEFLGL